MVGLRVEDWELMYEDEFEAVCKAHGKHEEEHYRDSWERMRLHASIDIQPHIKKKVSAHNLVPLPWDKNKLREEAETVSKEDARKEFERLIQNS